MNIEKERKELGEYVGEFVSLAMYNLRVVETVSMYGIPTMQDKKDFYLERLRLAQERIATAIRILEQP